MAEEQVDDTSSGGDVLSLGVRGYSCQIFDEPETAWKLHQESHLIPWRGESDGDLRVDRFDARNLLEDRSLFRQLKKRKRVEPGGRMPELKVEGAGKGEEETEQQILHRLRFGDYAVEFPPSEETFATENKFPYQYAEDESDEESDGEAFDPLWEVPEQLVMPKTKKLHAIIEATANKVRGHPQLEVMLKVKLGDNKKFRFLDASHALHAYYCFLRDENPQPTSKKSAVKVSLLGDEYTDSDDEAEDSTKYGINHEDDTHEQRQQKMSRHHQ
ncbi:hypothetical protein F443_17490 [Phytophthora nicotianae P1569]|uniref:SURP motif domain-containing protein n=2 Tax=Phytophthora nicotianae TaxID=4792 RepID=V9EBC8_PHYNI|nr:hypothetical protein F443_17490 [Phytophthora nicotianae P1569]ETO65081.1 hypothetical protein F444_17530 [Phytophthora nicotianae P1976]